MILLFHNYIGNVIIPTGELIFFQRSRSTTNQMNLKIYFGGGTCWFSGVTVHQTESVSNAGAKASLAYA